MRPDSIPVRFIDKTAQIFNSLVPQNAEQKAEEMREVLGPEHHKWLAYYLVKARASKEVNLHPTYIEFIDKTRSAGLMEDVRCAGESATHSLLLLVLGNE